MQRAKARKLTRKGLKPSVDEWIYRMLTEGFSLLLERLAVK